MATRKITISQLRPGMFIHELDIPWIKSPFLRHRRKIKSNNDIILLKQAGVKELHIDLTRGDDISSSNDEKEPEISASLSSVPLNDAPPEKQNAAEQPEEIAVPKSQTSETVCIPFHWHDSDRIFRMISGIPFSSKERSAFPPCRW